jgi:copper resistance protein B
MKSNRDCDALRIAAATLALLLAQPVIPPIALAQAQAEPALTGMPGMTMPAAGRAAPPAAAPPATLPRAAPPTAVPATVVPPATVPATDVPAPPNPAALGWPSPIKDNELNSFLLFDLFEFQRAPNVEAARWDIVGWYGGDIERVWFKSEGRYNGALRAGEMDLQLLYGRLITPFLDLQAGVRYERQLSWDNSRGRAFGVLGVQGLVPYGMELEAAVFVSQHGALSTRVTLSQDFLLSQSLILQPRFELNAAIQSAAQYGVGRWLNDTEVGLRLRYEFSREFAPYVGVSWLQSFGETAALRSAGGERRTILQLVTGFRMWF